MEPYNTDYGVFTISHSIYPRRRYPRGSGLIDEAVAQDALDETGIGKYNYKVVALSLFIIMNSSFSMLSLGFILPAAACDFQMMTEHKSHVAVSVMLGMLVSSYFWGCIGDAKGRKMPLLFALLVNGASEFLASVMPYYWGFLFLKFISGVAICGQLTLLYTYLAEFLPNRNRDLFLSFMEVGWAIGIVIVACVAWITIPLEIEYKFGHFSFHSWNLFIMICSLPALITGTCLSFFPETPKYLADAGQKAEMLNVLAKMYSENTGKPAEEYFITLKNSTNLSLSELVSGVTEKPVKQETDMKTVKNIVLNLSSQSFTLMKRPYLRSTFVLCSSAFLITSSYYMLILWLPDLFQRYADFQDRYPNQSASVCTVIHTKNNETIMDDFGCDTPIQNSVYLYAFIVSMTGVPFGILLPIFISCLGYTFFLASCTLIASIVSLCIFLVQTSIQNLIVSCFFESLTSICVCVVCCITVELYPTHLRSIAAGLAAVFTRFGAIFGNITTGLLIDNHCVALISLVAVQLFLCGMISLFTPKRKDPEKMEIIKLQSSSKIESERI